MRISDWSSDVCSSDLVAGNRAEAFEIDAPGFEIVGMRLEFLAERIALPLNGLAMGGVDADKGGELRVDPRDERVGSIQVACLAGAEISVAIRVRDGGGAAVGVDPFD